MHCRTPLLAGVAALVLVACGGGGGGGSAAPVRPSAPPPPETPFGLTAREPRAAFALPQRVGPAGTYDLRNAFENLPPFEAPLLVTAVPGEGRLAVVEQPGRVLAFEDDADASATEVVLDLTGSIVVGGELGLLGLAFDPDFVRNRFLYLHYTAAAPLRSVIARFSWPRGGPVDPRSRKIVLEVAQPYANHNGGMIAFGPDGYLYVALGDGGGAGDPDRNGQNPATLLGSLLRIDVHPQDPADPYTVPADNPFIDRAGFAPETWAFGLRNPFRFSFDRQTGDLWLGDVGQSAREEIDRVVRGGNYGWRRFEGALDFDPAEALGGAVPHAPPVLDYGRDQGVAVIGGYVYRGVRHAGLFGRYLYSDFGSGTIWALEWDGTKVRANDVVATAASPTAFGEDGNGEVLVVSRDGILAAIVARGTGASLPSRLSETGLFTDLATLTPAAGLVEFTLQLPSWSDGTRRRRWFSVPDGAGIGFDATGPWSLPTGSLAVEHLEIRLTAGDPGSDRRLETRLLLHTEEGWLGFTYRWNDAGTDAVLLTGRETEWLTRSRADGSTATQRYDYPSRTDCLRCHTQVAGRTLGLETRQLNRDFDYPLGTDNQLRALGHAGYLDGGDAPASAYEAYPALDDAGAAVADRARAWLAVNCAACHQPGGPAPGAMDLRFDTPLDAMGVLDAKPQGGGLGIPGARIVDPGRHASSVLWERIRRLDTARMPPLASHVVDEKAVSLIASWIDGL